MSEAWLVVGFTHGVVKAVLKRINVWCGVRVTGFMFMFGMGGKQQGVVGHQPRLEHCQAAGGLLHATPGS